MGQQEVIDYLIKEGKPLSASQIAEAIGKSISSVCFALSRMLKFKEITFIEIDRSEAKALLNNCIKRRMRLYSVV